jgi:predicted CXXCH cytochrome family protein
MMKQDKATNRIILLIVCMCSVLIISSCKHDVEQPKGVQVKTPVKAEFVERQLCIDCHEEQYKLWIGSHHDLAMDLANDKTVIGDFNDTTFTAHGVTSTFYKKDGKFFIRTDGRDGELHDYEITYVFGVDPLQQYMIEFPDGRIQMPDIGWDDHPEEKGGQRWFHIHPDDDITPDHIFHWTRRFLNWNYMCAECHTTNLQKNYDLKTNTFNTTWTMIDVGCQGCHGPGSNHVEWVNSEKLGNNKKDAYANMGLEVNLKAEDANVQLDACARCHSRRNGLRKDYQYGKPLMDYYVPQVLTDPFYYPDGQILDEVYVYGSFIQSKKYQKGVRCTDCHNPHTARLHSYGNELCIGCHSSPPPAEYTDLLNKDYNSPSHHFHKEDSPGAQCAECHMPETNYMVVDPRRDHKFQLPRPDLSVTLGIPNPCSRCHKDKSVKWAADIVDKWYPDTIEERSKETEAEIFASGQAGRSDAESGLIKIIRDHSRPPIIRATAINILSRFRTSEAIDSAASSLQDKDPFVRYEAVRSFSQLISKARGLEDQKKKYTLLVPFLKDPVLAVRSETARVLTEVPATLFAKKDLEDFDKALKEFIQRQDAIADRPEAHLNLGIMYENMGNYTMAETSYKTAIRLVNDFYPARFNLANLYNRLKRNSAAEQQFREIISQDPANGEAYYSLGLLLAEMNRLDDAAGAMEKAIGYMPERARVRYNHALVLRNLGRSNDALSDMLTAHELDQSDPGIVQSLAIFYIQERQWGKALPFAEKLVALVPDDPNSRQMLDQITQKMETK